MAKDISLHKIYIPIVYNGRAATCAKNVENGQYS